MKKEILIDSLIKNGICDRAGIRGATVEDVDELEKRTGGQLPEAYKEFLYGAGCGAGRFLQGTDIFITALDGLRKEAAGLLEESGAEAVLGGDAFVFSMHQGYEFLYFNLHDGDNPPVYQYMEGMQTPILTWNSFDDFLSDIIAQHSNNGSSAAR